MFMDVSCVNQARVDKVKERTTLMLQTSLQTKWCQADVWWLFLVVFLINEGLSGKIRTTKRHDLERTTWEMTTWNGGKGVRRQTATIATSPNTMVKYWQRHGFFLSFFEISDLLSSKTYNRGLLIFFSIYLLIITLNNYIYNTTEKKHFNNRH